MRRKKGFNNIYLDKYLEQAIASITPDQLQLLDSNDRFNIGHPSVFLKEGSLEEKLLLLAKLGRPHALIIADSSKQHSLKQLYAMVRIFFNKVLFKKPKALRGMKDAGVIALCDVDIVRAAVLAANVYNSPLYNLVNPYQTITAKINTYHELSKTALKEISAGHEIDKIITNAMMVGGRPQLQAEFISIYKITPQQYLLLSYLSKNRQAKHRDLTALIYNSDQHRSLAKLEVMGFIKSHEVLQAKKSVTKEYWITGTGELVLIEARRYFIKHIIE